MERSGPSFSEFFRRLTGHLPYPYQERAATLLLAGHSLVLRVPTGAGKTWTSLAPFLFARAIGAPIGDRLIYSLPLRSLASSIYSSVSSALAPARQEADSPAKPVRSPACSLQIGGQKDDPFFQSDLIFTTIDQLLSGYLFLPVSLPDRLANMNAGAIPGSLVVLDETHLLDPSTALGTVIEMLDRLKGLSQFVLMTATASDSALNWLANRLHAKRLDVSEHEIRQLPSQATKRRSWAWSPNPISAAEVQRRHQGGRTIALVNTVRRAQQLFFELQTLYQSPHHSPRLLLLHSRFFPEDRRRIEAELPACFGPDASQSDVILVTTQVIEAGMDLSAGSLLTDLAPMNALIQRAGRTARYATRPNGSVTVFEVESPRPYTGSQSPLVDATRLILQSLSPEGELIDFVREQQWIDSVHSAGELSNLSVFANLYSRREAVHKAMDLGDRGRLTQLVRDIDSVSVVISPDPKPLFEQSVWPRLLSVPSISLKSLINDIKGQPPGAWVVQGATESQTSERPGSELLWNPLSPAQLSAQWLVAIHPDYASYTPEIGLRLGVSGPVYTPPPAPRAPYQPYDYEFESWLDHAQRVRGCARAMHPAYACAAARIAALYAVPVTAIEHLVEVTCLLHDTGKLTADWQKAAWKWQDDKDARARDAGQAIPPRPRVPLAHTWFQAIADRPFRRLPGYGFPPHAVQGAYAVAVAILSVLAPDPPGWAQVATRCAISAIARHHAPRASELSEFSIPAPHRQLLGQLVNSTSFSGALRAATLLSDGSQFKRRLITFVSYENASAWPLYSFLVRRLRLADQSATANL